MFEIGDLVTRKSYKNDVLFIIDSLDGEIAVLKGVNVRLIADCLYEDLNPYTEKVVINDDEIIKNSLDGTLKERSKYFYIPGTILHIDGDNEYLNRCLSYYKKANIRAVGYCINEEEVHEKIEELLDINKPDVLVITGHDYFYKNSKRHELDNYKNSGNFVESVKSAREYEKDYDKLAIIAGACQSNYEELLKAGANFASSPKRVNIHALDPAIVASLICLTDRNETIDLMGILAKTKYKDRGMGGIKTKGCMYSGYPR